MDVRRAAGLVLWISLAVRGGTARADEPPPDGGSTLRVHGSADTYFELDTNRPPDHAAFEPGTGTSGKRANEFVLNAAAIDLSVEPKPVGFRVTLVEGESMQVLRAAEPRGAGIGPEVWNHVYQAYVAAKVPLGRGLLLQAGVYPSHVGFETFFTQDNWNYTHGWLGELSPYYQAGAMAQYAFTDRLSVQLHVLNGWSIIGENNDAKTLGTQVAWSDDRVALSFSTLAGPELPGDDTHWRLYGDVVGVLKPTQQVNVAVELDAGLQQRPRAESAHWGGVGGYLRLAPERHFAIALRGEYLRDPEAVVSPAGQSVGEGTATLELKPIEPLTLKLEGRYDRSTQALFSAHEGPRKDQGIALLGAVAAF